MNKRVETDGDIELVEMIDRRGNSLRLDEQAFRANVALTRAILPDGTKIYQCAKGNGYGVGVERIVRWGASAGIDGFCVGAPDEALRAKRVAGDLPVLLFAGSDPAALPEMVDAGIIVSVGSVEAFDRLARSGVAGQFFFKLDCGLRRYGLNEQSLLAVLDLYKRQSSARCVGIYTHLGSRCAEVADTALPFFDRIAGMVEEAVGGRVETMVASSTLILQRPDLPYSAVDPGRLLYGMMPEGMMPANATSHRLMPIVSQISSTLLQVTPFERAQELSVGYTEQVAIPAGGATGVFPLGWIDGLSTRGGFGEVLVRGARAPVIARTLQHSIVDLSGLPGAQVGDEVVLVGRQGSQSITLEAMAEAQGASVPELHFRLPAAIAAGAPGNVNS